MQQCTLTIQPCLVMRKVHLVNLIKTIIIIYKLVDKPLKRQEKNVSEIV